jgi:hypothetical protein
MALFRMARMRNDAGTEDLPGEDWRSKAEAKGERHTEDPVAIALERGPHPVHVGRRCVLYATRLLPRRRDDSLHIWSCG